MVKLMIPPAVAGCYFWVSPALEPHTRPSALLRSSRLANPSEARSVFTRAVTLPSALLPTPPLQPARNQYFNFPSISSTTPSRNNRSASTLRSASANAGRYDFTLPSSPLRFSGRCFSFASSSSTRAYGSAVPCPLAPAAVERRRG